METNEPMFDENSFNDLKDASEVKASVEYFSKNELNFRKQLADSGMSYDEIQKTLRQTWINLLKLCSKHNFSDYIITAKKRLYGVK